MWVILGSVERLSDSKEGLCLKESVIARTACTLDQRYLEIFGISTKSREYQIGLFKRGNYGEKKDTKRHKGETSFRPRP
jgi:hypothetical protein